MMDLCLDVKHLQQGSANTCNDPCQAKIDDGEMLPSRLGEEQCCSQYR